MKCSQAYLAVPFHSVLNTEVIDKVRRLQEQPGARHLPRLRVLPPPLQRPQQAPLVDADLRAHKQACAAAQSLPPHATPVPLPRAASGNCHVCDRDIEFESVRLLTCARCGVTVHNTCYDVRNYTDGAAWLCEPCEAGVKTPPVCALCPVAGGALRWCKGGEWVHAACALWTPGALVAPKQPPDLAAVRKKQKLKKLKNKKKKLFFSSVHLDYVLTLRSFC
jgi:PHD-finger/PHD-zinc-finger like domain